MSTINVPLTKSQKKRMKRNKAKARKAENSSQQVPVLDPLNAHDAVKIGLQKLGFELSDIDKSMDKMWSADLDYSDIKCVAAFMTAEQAAEDANKVEGDDAIETVQSAMTADAPASSSDLSKVRAQSEEEMKTVSSSPSSKSFKESTASNVPLTVTNTGFGSVSEAVSETPSQPEVADSVSSAQNGNGDTAHSDTQKKKTEVETKSTPKAPPSLRTKLDIVANDEHLTNAIVALTEWIVKAATPSEIKELCDSSKSCGLRTVIRRVIMDSGPRNFAGQLLDLIGSILRVAGIPSTELSSSAKTLMHTLTRAKSAIKMDESMSEAIADVVADMVTLNIFKSSERISSASSGASGSLALLDAEIESLKSAQVPNDTGIGGLAAKRDKMKTLAQKHLNLLNIKLHSIPEVNDVSINENDVSKDEMMEKVFGEKFEEVAASKVKYDELKRLQQVSNTHSTERESIVSSIDTLQANKASVSEKIQELEIEMKRLTAEGGVLEKKIVQAQNKLHIFDDSLSEEAKEAEKVLGELSKTIKVNDSVSHVVDSLQDFQAEMKKVTSAEMASLQTNVPAIDIESDLPPRMNAYIASMNDYFNSEFKLVSSLQGRAEKLRYGFPRLEMEIEECQSLGMTSNVVAMKKKLSQMQQNIADDDNVIKALQQEADEMKCGLLDVLKEYKSTGAKSHSHESLLSELKSTINATL